MSLVNTLFELLTETDTASRAGIEHPCTNCPGSSTIAPEACEVCEPYKKQMIDAIYKVEHKEELLAGYEVVGVSAPKITAACPYCGAVSQNRYICDYCRSTLQEGSEKIQVASAADIPNPVLDAQNIIFARYEAVKAYTRADSGYGLEEALAGIENQGFFSAIFSALSGKSTSYDSTAIGNKMTEAEIEEMASYYGVSVAEYLTGLDDGKYLTLSYKDTCVKTEKSYWGNTSGSNPIGTLSGAAGALTLGSLLFGGRTYNRTLADKGRANRNARRKQIHTPPARPADRPESKPMVRSGSWPMERPEHMPGSRPMERSEHMPGSRPEGFRDSAKPFGPGDRKGPGGHKMI